SSGASVARGPAARAGAAAHAAAGTPLTICGDLALSGGYTQIGETDNWGATAFFKAVDAAGGIDGHMVDYVVINNQSSPAESEAIAKECILQKHASFIVGPESGADTESAMPLAIAYHVPLISLSSGWQSNGYPASEEHSYAFPGFYDVFYEDDLASVQNLIVPRHYTRVALIMDNCGSVCLANGPSMTALAKQYHFKMVATTTFPFGATDITANVLSLLAAKPQIIIFGLVPGTDSITAIKAIRAQDPTIPISECSACELPSFIAAAGGAKAMQNIYVLGSMQNWLTAAEQGTSAEAKLTATGLKAYFAGMKAAGLDTENEIDNSQEGWDAGLEIQFALDKAGTTSEPQVMDALQHLDINTLGIVWNRNPSNYEDISDVLQAMEVILPNGSAALYKG
ncbi:MAG TPA: ABC transporter substrate-binding protein, partial [Acidimicrobiales bacterium]|nr:ABC transporter substrate-binding protein [Acidimicrobiales bacterium]